MGNRVTSGRARTRRCRRRCWNQSIMWTYQEGKKQMATSCRVVGNPTTQLPRYDTATVAVGRREVPFCPPVAWQLISCWNSASDVKNCHGTGLAFDVLSMHVIATPYDDGQEKLASLLRDYRPRKTPEEGKTICRLYVTAAPSGSWSFSTLHMRCA